MFFLDHQSEWCCFSLCVGHIMLIIHLAYLVGVKRPHLWTVFLVFLLLSWYAGLHRQYSGEVQLNYLFVFSLYCICSCSLI